MKLNHNLKKTNRYGCCIPDPNLAYFDDKCNLFGSMEFNTLFEYAKFVVRRVDIWIGMVNGVLVIAGLQFHYKDLDTYKNKFSPLYIGNCDGQRHYYFEMEKHEWLTDFRVYFEGNMLTALCLSTNLGNEYRIGNKDRLSRVYSGVNSDNPDIVLFAPFGCYNRTIETLGFYYFERERLNDDFYQLKLNFNN